MSFRHNSTGVEPSQGGKKQTLFDKGEYAAVIVDATEKVSEGKKTKGMPMLELDCQIIEHERYHGEPFKHWIVFMPADMDGAGMSVHFRKCIGLPYGGDDEVDARDYKDKKFRVEFDQETKPYTSPKNGKTYTEPRNKIIAITHYGADFPPVVSHEAEGIPF